jgi:acyl-CoA synthetase (NDP forming)
VVPPLGGVEQGAAGERGIAHAPLVRSVPGKPTVACAMESGFLPAADGVPPVPTLPLPEDAVRALASVIRYAQWLRRDPGDLVPRTWEPEPRPGGPWVGAGTRGVASTRARRLVEEVLSGSPSGRELTDLEVAELLECYGVILTKVPRSAAEGAAGSGAGSRPVGPADGVPCRVATTEDPTFGPLVCFGLAGQALDLLEDVAYRIPPLHVGDVRDLVLAVRAAPLLLGHGGRRAVDLDALERVVGRVSVLAEDLPQVASLVLDPVVAHPAGCVVSGARARVAPSPTRVDFGRRALLDSGA